MKKLIKENKLGFILGLIYAILAIFIVYINWTSTWTEPNELRMVSSDLLPTDINEEEIAEPSFMDKLNTRVHNISIRDFQFLAYPQIIISTPSIYLYSIIVSEYSDTNWISTFNITLLIVTIILSMIIWSYVGMTIQKLFRKIKEIDNE